MSVKKIFFPLFIFVLLIFTANAATVLASPSPDKLEWHSSIKKGTKLAWKLTDSDDFDEKIGKALGLSEDPVLKVEFAADLPTRVQSGYTEDILSSISLYLDDHELMFSEFLESSVFIFVFPIYIQSSDGKEINLIDYFQMLDYRLSSEIQGDYIITTGQTGRYHNDGETTTYETVTLKHHIDSGILAKVSFSLRFSFEYFARESSINIDGSPVKGSLVSGFETFPLGLVIVIFIIIRSKKR